MFFYRFKEDMRGRYQTICDVDMVGNEGALFPHRHEGLDKFVKSGLMICVEGEENVRAYFADLKRAKEAKPINMRLTQEQVLSQTIAPTTAVATETDKPKEVLVPSIFGPGNAATVIPTNPVPVNETSGDVKELIDTIPGLDTLVQKSNAVVSSLINNANQGTK